MKPYWNSRMNKSCFTMPPSPEWFDNSAKPERERCRFQLESELQARHGQGLLRQRQILQSGQGASLLIEGRQYLNFSSNDYLGAASQPAIAAAWQQGLATWGAGIRSLAIGDRVYRKCISSWKKPWQLG